MTYDQYYLEGVKQGVQYGWTNPQNVGQEVEVALSKVNDEVQAVSKNCVLLLRSTWR